MTDRERPGDFCPECKGQYRVMLGRIDHRYTCSHVDAATRERIERDLERSRAVMARQAERSKTTADQTKPGRATSRQVNPSTRSGAVVQDLITGRVYTPEMDDHIETELRGGIGQMHPADHDCPLCEDNRRRALRRELVGIPGATPKREMDL